MFSIDMLLVDAWTIAFSNDSRYLASGSHAGKISLYSVETGKRDVQLDTRGGKFALSLAYVSYRFVVIKILSVVYSLLIVTYR